MSKKDKIKINDLTVDMLEKEINNQNYKSRYILLLKNTIYTVVIIFAFCIILATLVMPVFEINGDSMNPTYNDGNVVVAINTKKFKQDEIIAFYYENKILVRRIIATEGQWINIKDGIIYVDGKEITSPSNDEEAFSYGDIEYPFQVPGGQLFVLSDNRKDSQDSRYSQIGCIKRDDIVGKVIFKLFG